MTDYLNSLKNLRNKLQAGKTSLNESEMHELLFETTKTITASTSDHQVINDQNLIEELSELFFVILEGDYLKIFISKFEESDYFSVGITLKNSYDEGEKSETNSLNKLTYQYLNFFRYSDFLKKISNNEKWTKLISDLIDFSAFNTKELFKQRVSQYGKETLFNVLKGDKITSYSWEKINSIVGQHIKSFLYLINERKGDPEVAFLTENSLDMALLDIACLNAGIVNVMIPANSVPQHISYILNQTKCKIIILSNEKQLAKLKSVKSELKYLQTGILLDGTSAEEWIISFNDFKALNTKGSEIDSKFDLPMGSTSTIMYTSGTTGEPKGIIFSQKNIIFKRFCRAIALSGINDDDRYLSYLPLYHTFGRWLELFGTIFWGASYSFMENPSAETMIANMKMIKPSIFISIPKKWSQLYEHISTKVNIEDDSEEEISKVLKKVTGGNLKWGLSAAGYLSPDVFQFFQKYGIELMSGFGMTEATGGITMTPPGQYKLNSLGKALPGIEIKLADDGELLVKGEYVMPGYYDQSYEETFIGGGWFPTGDIMKMDSNGFIEIIDRKKEIYQNTKGETIAPQRIENLFREFDAVKQVFVVGDHRPFNTVLIYPDYESNTLKDLYDDQKGEFFANLIVTTNKFLAPFERIVDFRIIARPFSAEFGELTPKSTYKRRVIEKNFDQIIEELYQKDYYSLMLENTEIRIPNWFLRERGCLSGDIKIENSILRIQKLDKELTFEKLDDKIFRIGDYSYLNKKPYIEFHDFLINPIYWLGNEELVAFTDEAILQWYRQNSEEKSIKFIGRFESNRNLDLTRTILWKISSAGEKSLFGLHLALIMIRSDNIDHSNEGFQYLSSLLNDQLQGIYKIASYFLDKPIIANNSQIQKKMLLLALEHTKTNKLKSLFETYLKLGPAIFDDFILDEIVKIKKCLESVDMIDEILNEKIQLQFQSKNIDDSVIPVLLDLISRFGIRHPTRYEELRRKLVSVQLIQDWPELS
ncbi:MAG: AMP-binding protein, partial [Melioribacteraceae bacterium]|nr:AMP-binding protein [Melioribacteraceae bacterium]